MLNCSHIFLFCFNASQWTTGIYYFAQFGDHFAWSGDHHFAPSPTALHPLPFFSSFFPFSLILMWFCACIVKYVVLMCYRNTIIIHFATQNFNSKGKVANSPIFLSWIAWQWHLLLLVLDQLLVAIASGWWKLFPPSFSSTAYMWKLSTLFLFYTLHENYLHPVLVLQLICENCFHPISVLQLMCENCFHPISVLQLMCENCFHPISVLQLMCENCFHPISVLQLMCENCFHPISVLQLMCENCLHSISVLHFVWEISSPSFTCSLCVKTVSTPFQFYSLRIWPFVSHMYGHNRYL